MFDFSTFQALNNAPFHKKHCPSLGHFNAINMVALGSKMKLMISLVISIILCA